MARRLISDIICKEPQKRVKYSKERLDLSDKKIFRIPLKKIMIYGAISFSIFYLLLGAANAPISEGYLLAASNVDTQRAAYEAQLQDLENQIAQDEQTIEQYSKQGASLSVEIKKLNARISQLNLQIKAITLTLAKISGDISVTKLKISQTESDISTQKSYLSAVLQSVYESDTTNAVQIMLTNPKLSDFFLDLNNLLATQDDIRSTLDNIVQLKSNLIDQKGVLASQYNDTQQLQEYQLAQQQTAQQTEAQKNDLLKVTKGQQSKYEQIVAAKKKTAAQIRSQLYQLLGGGQLQFGDAYQLAKTAQDATGVRAALILAVLDRESALGRNVGNCKYNINPYYPNKASNSTTMNPKRDIPIFIQIMQSLNISPDSVSVSCPIPRDGAYGGGMGPAQFIPSTWSLYQSQIASITGHSVPSPWNNLDAFVATALYLKDAGATGSLYNEKVAAAKYYAGGSWQYYINTYGAAVIAKADEFQGDIDVLTG